MKPLLLIALVGTLVLIPCQGAEAPDTRPYLTEKGDQLALTHPLVLREEQGGFGGRSVTSWTIEPAGVWSVTKKSIDLKGKERSGTRVLRKGTLAKPQLESLVKVLAANQFLTLPAHIGPKAKVNPHTYTLRFGKDVSTLSGLPPHRSGTLKAHAQTWIKKQGDQLSNEKKKAAERFAVVAQAVADSCQARSATSNRPAE